MGLIERRTGKPFRSIQAQATESEDGIFVGPGWIRTGRNVNCPMADAAARREVKVPQVAHGRSILNWALFFLAVAAVIIAWWLE
jgi:hypothetical protein